MQAVCCAATLVSQAATSMPSLATLELPDAGAGAVALLLLSVRSIIMLATSGKTGVAKTKEAEAAAMMILENCIFLIIGGALVLAGEDLVYGSYFRKSEEILR